MSKLTKCLFYLDTELTLIEYLYGIQTAHIYTSTDQFGTRVYTYQVVVTEVVSQYHRDLLTDSISSQPVEVSFKDSFNFGGKVTLITFKFTVQ